jgi:TolB-like protein
MPERPEQTPSQPASSPDSDALQRKKKKDKVRSAWISFFGRIIAQVFGAVASIVLGVLILQNYQAARNSETPPRADPTPSRTQARDPGVVGIAVLPLTNLSGDPQQEYFADGMTEALISDLAQIPGLRVTSRTSSMYYKGLRKPLPDVAQELGVDLVLEGSVARSGDRVRVTAQLIDAARDQHVWARTYDQRARDVLSLQGQIASAVALEVRGALTASQQSRFVTRAQVDPAVYDLYLKGRYAWNQRTQSGFQEAIRYFDEAIRRDPSFALAYAGLSDAYGLLGGVPDRAESNARAKAAAERALALDDTLAEAHTSLAAHLHRNELRPAAAERQFRRAIELNPGYATAHQWYAILLAEEGREQEAAGHAQRAVTLDPLSGVMHQTLALLRQTVR